MKIPASTEGFVYVVSCGEFVKLGFSSTPHRRIAALKGCKFVASVGGGLSLKVRGVIKAVFEDEGNVHKRWKKTYDPVSKEWYRYSPLLEQEITSMNLVPLDGSESLASRLIEPNLSGPVKVHRDNNMAGLLRVWRSAEKESLREFASELGISAATLHRVEAGHYVDGSTLAKILTWLMSEETV